VHASREQPIAEIEALRKRHVQARVEHELRAAGFARNLPYRASSCVPMPPRCSVPSTTRSST
jgi:hypothetical protein